VARVLITDPADADSAAIIGDLTTKAGELVADRYDAEFDALYRRLEAFPESGSPYVVIYRHIPDDDLVAIVRILHGRRRITRRLSAQPLSRP
jgi:toxin ParE1/3/4